MDRRAFVTGLGAVLAAPRVAEAQQARKAPVVGVLRSGSPPDRFVEVFRQGLRELAMPPARGRLVGARQCEPEA